MSREAHRIQQELSPDEQSRLRDLRKQVEAELPDMVERDQLRKTASEEDTPSGALRRAIHQGDSTLTEIARLVGITTLELDEFLTGESTLQSDVIDRLAELVGCKLVPIE
jgi:hypothetical protein